MNTGLPTLRRCKCGSTPLFYAKPNRDGWQLQLKCACGNHGAVLRYAKPEQEVLMQQAAIDGWNMGQG